MHGSLAETELALSGVERSLATVEQGPRTARETGERATDGYLHRLRGDILLKRGPPDVARAEEAYREAIAVAQEQGARSYFLLASLALARLLQSNNRLLEAHDVLAPALDGFTPSPELPTIAEAQALLAELERNEPIRRERPTAAFALNTLRR